jgi:hypothetical protein
MRPSHIKSQFETDEQNRKEVCARIGAAAALPDDLVRLYGLHYSAIATQLPDYPAQIAGTLYVACRKHLVLGITSLFRRYSSQAFRETRTAVEAAGIANAIRLSDESFRIFREDRDEDSRKAARKRFIPARLFVGELARLKEYYDKASELSHTNRRTFGPHLNLGEGTFCYQDLRDADIPKLATNYLIWICVAHMTILEMADFIFSDAQGDLVVKFKRERRYLGEKIYRFNLQNEGSYYQPNNVQ